MLSEEFKIETIFSGTEIHQKGNIDCKECMYPVANPCPCGGVIHFFDYDEYYIEETGDEGESMDSICDLCGKSWYEVSDACPRTTRSLGCMF